MLRILASSILFDTKNSFQRVSSTIGFIMNASTFVWFLLAVQLVKCGSDVIVKDSAAGVKLDDLISEYRVMDPPKENLFEDAQSAVKVLHNPISMRVLRGGPDHLHNYQLNFSSILIFDSVENFVEHVRSIKWVTNKRFRHPHLVYIPGVTMSDILENIHDGFLIDHVAFLVHEPDGSIGLATSFMFTKEKCRTNQLVTINKFTNVQMRWEDMNFYPKKYDNFHGCTLNAPLHALENIFNDIAKVLNVRISYNDTRIDLLAAHQFDGDKKHITSDTIVAMKKLWIVPPGEPYSQFEKMFLPFDDGTWIAICLTFVLAIITVQAIKLFPMKVQHFVFGRNFYQPTLNIFNLFLTGGQWRVPERNFSRYILTLFTVWCLIIRTCYQSKMFDFLQEDMRKSGPHSMEDMGYTAQDNPYGFNIWVEDVYDATKYAVTLPMNRTKFAYCGKPDGQPADAKKRLNIIAEPANRAFTHVIDSELIRVLNRIGSGNPSFVILDKKWRTHFMAVSFKTFCPFYQTFNQIIGFLLSSGIPQQFWDSGYKIRGRDLTWKDAPMGPRVLTLDDLQIGFIIHLVCLGISTVVFFLEIITIMLSVVVAYIRNLYPGGAKLPQKRPVEDPPMPLKLKPKPNVVKVKSKSPSNARVQLEIHAEDNPKAESSDPQLDDTELFPQCPTESALDFALVNLQAESLTRKVGAEVLELEDGRGGFIDISDLDFEDDCI